MIEQTTEPGIDIDQVQMKWYGRRGRHRLPYRARIWARLDRLANRPVAALLVAAGAGFATSGVIEFARLVTR